MKPRNAVRNILAAVLLLNGMAIAQINSLSGTIRDAQTLEPLPYANVIIKDTYLGATSNVDGYFYLSGLESDSVVVVCTYIGYENAALGLTYKGESHIIIPFELTPVTLGGEEVLVEDSLLMSPEFTIQKLFPDDTTFTEVQPIVQSISELPQFRIDLHPPLPWFPRAEPGVQLLVDGVPLESPFRLYGIYPSLNVDAVKLIAHHTPGTILESGAPYREVTELIYQEGNRTGFDISGKLGLVESGLTTSGPHPLGGSWYLSGRRVDFDGIYSMAPQRSDSAYTAFMPDYYFYDISSKITFDLNAQTKASATAFLNYDKLHWLGESGRSAHTSWYSRFVSGRVQHRFSPRFSTTANVYMTQYHAFHRATAIPLGRDLTLDGDLIHDFNTGGIRITSDYYLPNRNALVFGLGIRGSSANLVLVDSSTAALPSPLLTSFEAGYRHALPHHLDIDLGLRGQINSKPGLTSIDPVINLAWSPSNVYGAYVHFSQATEQMLRVSLSNTLEQPLLDVILPRDESLAVPKVVAARFGVLYVPVIGYDIQGEFFMEKLQNPVLMDSAWTGDLSDQSQWLMPYASGARTGLQVSLEKRTPGPHLRLRYRLNAGSLEDNAGTTGDFLGERDHQGQISLTGDLGEKLSYRVEGVMASGRHYLDADGDAALTPFYHRIDASIQRSIQVNRVRGAVSFCIYNLTAQSADPLQSAAWSPLTSTERDFALLPFLPTVRLDFEF